MNLERIFERIKSGVVRWTPDFVKRAFARIPRVQIHLSRRQQIAGGVLLLLVAGGLLWLWLRPRPEIVVLPVVEVEPVTTQDVNIYGEYVGRIRAQQFVEIRARVEGYLEKMLFAEGTYIQKGQTLFVIDPRLYRARANKAAAQLNKARALSQSSGTKATSSVRPVMPSHPVERRSAERIAAANFRSMCVVLTSTKVVKATENFKIIPIFVS